MRDNQHLALHSPLVTLVPYDRGHVAKYNQWMQDPWLQEMTASEPLTLEEEIAMQKDWRDDAGKCTFIILDAATSAMVGDVNLYFESDSGRRVAEIEVMIAEPAFRRRGMAEEALWMMMAYASGDLGTSRFVAKILQVNKASIALFTAKLGFEVQT
eukprot:g2736.t1